MDIGIGIWLAYRNGKIALEKGHSQAMWAIITLGLWFGMEVFGILVVKPIMNPHDTSLATTVLFGYALAIPGGIAGWWLVGNLQPQAWVAVANSWMPSCYAPAGGLPVTDLPDPTRPAIGMIPEFQPLMVESRAGDWAQVRVFNGWRGWVDARMLISGNPAVGATKWQ